MLTVVTVTKNNLNGLLRTINSLDRFANRCEMELIIIDGASTDGTVNYLNNISGENQNFKARVVSEIDDGIYHAMNKGILKSNGKYILFLNAGDELACKINSDFMGLLSFSAEQKIQLLYFDYILTRPGYTSTVKKGRRILSQKFPFMPTSHQAMLFEANTLKSMMFDDSFHISGDFELVCRLLKRNTTYCYLPTVLINFHAGGVSSTQKWLLFRESAYSVIKYTRPRILIIPRLIVLFARIFI